MKVPLYKLSKLYPFTLLLLHRPAADASCSLTSWQHFPAWSDLMAAILNVWHQIENLTPSIDAYLHKNHLCQISSRSDLNNGALGF